MRKPYEGVWNVVRFNWHYYILSLVIVVVVMLLQHMLGDQLRIATNIMLVLVVGSTFISLAVSYYIYDLSGLYQLSWLQSLHTGNNRIMNVNAGFDETSALLKSKYTPTELLVVDFYNPEQHTEISIKRARKAYPPFAGTQQVSTNHLPVESSSLDNVFAILSAHEIRDANERIMFFREMRRVLRPQGQIIVTEHLRDLPNFLAYNVGFMHFHPRSTWLQTFTGAGLSLVKEIKITPFITTFILEKNGTAY